MAKASVKTSAKTETAIFAAGCFWGVEEMFRQMAGVISTEVGYTGGHTENPTYEDVCFNDTGHAEAIRIQFDPEKISYEKLLEMFFSMHNPTTPNQQGPDFGTEYRSAIFFLNPEQKVLAEVAKDREQTSGKWRHPVVTEIVAAMTFYPAEDYHQKYLMKRGLGSCHI